MIIRDVSDLGNTYLIIDGYVANFTPFVRTFKKPDGTESIMFTLVVDTKVPYEQVLTGNFKSNFQNQSITCFYYCDSEKQKRRAKILKSLSGYERMLAWGKVSGGTSTKSSESFTTLTVSDFILPDRVNALLYSDDLPDNSEVTEMETGRPKQYKKADYSQKTVSRTKSKKPKKTTKATDDKWFD